MIKKSKLMTRILPLIALSALFVGCANTPKPITTHATKPKITLILGGGGAKGFAHVGVLEALETHNIKPDIIIGTSSGAMVGAMYALGKSAQELRQIALHLDENELIDITPSKQGLIEGEKLAKFINTQVNFTPLEKLPLRFVPVATNAQGQAITFQTGDTGQAVRASASVPKLFIAPRLPKNHGQKYSDGGQSALVPARFAKGLGADVVISVDVLAHKVPTPPKTTQTATISRTKTGFSGKFGNQVIDIPIDFNKIKNQIPLDMGEELDTIISQIPAHSEFTLPSELDIIQNPQSFWQKFEPKTQADPQDLAVSDVIIRPDLSKFSVFNTSERQQMMDIGKQSTLNQMDTIKQHIQHKTP